MEAIYEAADEELNYPHNYPKVINNNTSVSQPSQPAVPVFILIMGVIVTVGGCGMFILITYLQSR